MSGSRIVWKEVLAIYSDKTTTDPDNLQEVATMNEISSRTKSKTETVITETNEGYGNIVQTEITLIRTCLYITDSHKTTEEMIQL